MFKLAVFVALVAAVYGQVLPAAYHGIPAAYHGLPAALPAPISAAYRAAIPAPLNPYVKHLAAGPEAAARIVSQQQDAAPDNSGYAFSYETENGIAAQEQGQYHPITPEDGVQAVIGSYRYPLPDGRMQIVEYTADENGYRPVVKFQ